MVTVSHIVSKLIRKEPVVEDALAKGLFNYSKLAQYLKPKIELELGKEVRISAIVMAIARNSEKLKEESSSRVGNRIFSQAELSVRSGVAEITIQKTPSCVSRLVDLYKVVDLAAGDVLNINIGASEISIIFTERYISEFRKVLSEEKIKIELTSLSELEIRFHRDYLYEPGFIYEITRHLSWYNLNIIEIVSTLGELIIVIDSSDATAAYGALQELFGQKKKK